MSTENSSFKICIAEDKYIYAKMQVYMQVCQCVCMHAWPIHDALACRQAVLNNVIRNVYGGLTSYLVWGSYFQIRKPYFGGGL